MFWLDIQINGKRFRESLKTSNKKLAERIYTKRKYEIVEEILKTNKPIKLEVFFKEYCKFNKEKAYLEREKQRMGKVLNFWGRGVCLHEIDVEKIEKLKEYLCVIGRSEATINRYFALLRMLINRAILMNKMNGENPFKKLKFFREGIRKRKNLNKVEIRLLLDKGEEISKNGRTFAQRYLYDVLLIALNTGMRIREILELKKENIDFNRGLIFVEKTKTRVPRNIPMNGFVYDVFKKIMPKGDGYIIPATTKNKSDAFREQIKKLRNETGIKKFIGFHNLRHTFATNLLENGADFLTVQELLGHTTSRVKLGYTHTSMNRKKEGERKGKKVHTAIPF